MVLSPFSDHPSVERIVGWVAARADLDERLAFAIFIAVAGGLAGAFVLGLARGAVRMAWLLATSVIPDAGHARDLGHSPRRALVLTLELAIVLVLGLPLAALVQPLIPGGGVLVLGVIALLALATRRSIDDFAKHVHAGSSLILEVLARQGVDKAPPALGEVEAMLPGFEGLTPITLAAGAPAIGKTLAELDLRARTGASVLAISREGGGVANPSPGEPLRSGDVLAVTGSADAIAAARSALLGA